MNLQSLPLRDFVKLAPILPRSVAEQLLAIPKPRTLCGVSVPTSLDHLTMGELAALQGIDPAECVTAPAVIVLGCTTRQVESAPVSDVLGFNNFVSGEMRRIAGMFEAIPRIVTDEMRRAGIGNLNFGVFGLVDNYARRMGITNHDYVLECVEWLTVYQCMNIDAQTAQFEKRLRDITLQKR